MHLLYTSWQQLNKHFSFYSSIMFHVSGLDIFYVDTKWTLFEVGESKPIRAMFQSWLSFDSRFREKGRWSTTSKVVSTVMLLTKVTMNTYKRMDFVINKGWIFVMNRNEWTSYIAIGQIEADRGLGQMPTPPSLSPYTQLSRPIDIPIGNVFISVKDMYAKEVCSFVHGNAVSIGCPTINNA